MPVEITALTDSQSDATDFSECEALLGVWLPAGDSTSCTYYVSHTEVGSYGNVASVTVADDEGKLASDEAEAEVEVTDVLPTVELVKSADPTVLPEPGGDFEFTLTITNTSVEAVEITILTDSQSAATDFSNCMALVGTTLAPGTSTSCTYTVTHADAGAYGNTASVTVEDNEGNSASDEDIAVVEVTDVLPTVELVKSADPTVLPEPGGDFEFTLTITNTSVEAVEITALTDTQSAATDFSECEALVNTWLPAGESTTCTYTVAHTDAGAYDNTASVTVADNEGNDASDFDDETVTVTDVEPTVELVKSADPIALPEPGGDFEFTLTITNTSVEPVEITELTDTNALSTECLALIGTVLSPFGTEGDTVSCAYTLTHTDPGVYENTASVTVVDNEGNDASDSDDRLVEVLDVPPVVDLVKDVAPGSLPEPGGDFTFTLTVYNLSVEPVWISDLVDDNPLPAECTALIGEEIPVGGSVSCSYVVSHLDAGVYENTASVTVADDEENTATDTDVESVEVTDLPIAVSLQKSADPIALPEPGGDFEFTLTITNTSVEPVEITELTDTNALSAECLALIGTVLSPFGTEGDTVSCVYTVTHTDPGVYENTASATVVDNEQNHASDTDEAAVTIVDTPSLIGVTKTAGSSSVAEPGAEVLFTVVVENLSEVDGVTIESLVDDVYGDLDGLGDCAVPQSLDPGDTYTCTFAGLVMGNAGESHTNVVTAAGEDDDGMPVEDDDDAVVQVSDLSSGILVTKAATQTTITEPGGPVTFLVSVANTSAADTITLTDLFDSVFGDLDGQGDCTVPQTILPGEAYTCSFVGEVAGSGGDIHVNVVTGTAVDDDGVVVTDEDDAVVEISDEPVGVIGDYVWNDLDEDGVQDGDEPGIGGVVVDLFDASGTLVGTTTTGANGLYRFVDVPAGDYYVRFTAPDGWDFTVANQGGDDDADSDAENIGSSGETPVGSTEVFTHEAGETDLTRDAGLFFLSVSPQTVTTTTTLASTTIGTLPFTGFGQGGAGGLGLALIVAGGIVLIALRRREDRVDDVPESWEAEYR
jgi:hypothetical protein